MAGEPPPTIETLAARADLRPLAGATYTFKSWHSAATKLIDQAVADLASGRKEDAYVGYMKATGIAIDMLPKLKDYATVKKDPAYIQLKGRIFSDVLPKLEALKLELQEARRAWEERRRPSNPLITPVDGAPLDGANVANASRSSAERRKGAVLSGEELDLLGHPSHFLAKSNPPGQDRTFQSAPSPALTSQPTPAVISPAKLLEYLADERVTVLFLDLRGMMAYAQGHIAWKRPKWLAKAREGIADKEVWETGAVCCMEPEWFSQTNLGQLSGTFLEQRVMTTSFLSSPSPYAFRKRFMYNLVVYLDQSSMEVGTNPMLANLVRVLWERAPLETRTARRPALLEGGFDAWTKFVRTQPGGEANWIEVGDGWGGLDVEGKCGPDGSMNNRTPGTNKENMGSRPPVFTEPVVGKDIVRSVHDLIGNPASRSHYTQPSAPSFTQAFSPPSAAFSRENNFARMNSEPIPAPKPTLSRVSSSSGAARFDDPFYGYGFNYPALQAPESRTLSPTDSNFATSSSLPAYLPPGVSPGTPPTSLPTGTGSGFRPALPPPMTPKPAGLMAQNQRPSAPPMPLEPPTLPPPIGASQVQRSVTFPPPIPTKPPSISGAAHMFVPRAISPSLIGGPTRYFGRAGATPAIPPKPDHLTVGSQSDLGAETAIGLTGLRNLGNTCFMNSTIQCLSGTVSLSRYFLDGSYRHNLNRDNSLGTRGVVADSFALLLRTMWQAQLPFVSPADFREAICQFAPQFRGNEQHDSQEFLAFLMDAIHEDLNSGRPKGIKPPPPLSKAEEEAEEKLPEFEQSRRAWTRYVKMNSSIIVRDFQGQLGSILQCLTCGTTSTTFNTFMYLSLPIPSSSSTTLHACLSKFLERENLDGSDAWMCTKCKQPRKSSKQLWLSKLPHVLMIHLKRFYYSGPFRNKVDTFIDFPLRGLDLAPVVRYKDQGVTYTYDLYAISNHYGGLNGGHYTAFVRSGYRQGRWYHFDDSRVEEIGETGVKVSWDEKSRGSK